MAGYRITIINRDFRASEDVEASSLDAARTEALRGALNIGTDEICEGKMFFGAEISIQGDGHEPERLMVAIGTSPLSAKA